MPGHPRGFVEDPASRAVGAVLAGGRGRRLGGSKALAILGGRALISYPVQAMRAVPVSVAVVAKPDTELPALADAELWTEPGEPRHPLVGICHALRRAAGRPVLVCAADLPFVTPESLARLARADPGDAPAVIAVSASGMAQPLLGCYQPAALEILAPAATSAVAPLRAAVAALGPRHLELADDLLFNVNTPDDLERAERRISQT
ncbi:MAG: NTP transferase domain-containing protein [Solirubrobacteraceae bacterium]